ncbi:hypothetical protein DFJ77DRAFT_439423 [Powellomyces hirtus]|nr:hypothetical protein DFJ77DRAFT_439423 [Powellomyces hirtus]
MHKSIIHTTPTFSALPASFIRAALYTLRIGDSPHHRAVRLHSITGVAWLTIAGSSITRVLEGQAHFPPAGSASNGSPSTPIVRIRLVPAGGTHAGPTTAFLPASHRLDPHVTIHPIPPGSFAGPSGYRPVARSDSLPSPGNLNIPNTAAYRIPPLPTTPPVQRPTMSHPAYHPLTDADIQTLQLTLSPRSDSELRKMLEDPSGLDRFTAVDLKNIIKFLNVAKQASLKVTGNKAELVHRIRTALFPGRSPAISSGPSTPTSASSYGYSHTNGRNTGYGGAPPTPVLLSGAQPRDPNPPTLDKAWQKLRTSHLLTYALVHECKTWQFVHGHMSNRQAELSLPLDLAGLEPGRQKAADTRFFLHVYSDVSSTFVSEKLLRRDLRISVNHIHIPSNPNASDVQQYVDITAQIRNLPEKSTARVHLMGPASAWPSGIASVLCMTTLPIEKAVAKVYEQTLRQNGVFFSPLSEYRPGFDIFNRSIFPSVEAAYQRYNSEIVMRLATLSNKAGANDDDDVQMGNQIVSFQCPLTLTRIKIPCKSAKCFHKQCFDCEAFLSFNRTPTSKWKCPVCNKALNGSDLMIDATVSRLLSKYPDADRCMILPNGEDVAYDESTPKPEPSSNKRKHSDMYRAPEDVIELDDDDDDNEDGHIDKKMHFSRVTPTTQQRDSPAKRQSSLPEWSGTVISLDD